MAVTKVTYTATATWTAAQLADIFKQAFIDAGLMTDWFDSFLNTVENRVLRVVNDGSKTYGTVYYWFMFTTSGVFYQTTNTWNATTHVPTGTANIDYYTTATNVTTNHGTLISLLSTTSCTITRYTSGVNSSVTWFLVRSGSTSRPFMLSNPGFNCTSLVDMNRMSFNNFLSIAGFTNNQATKNVFFQIWHLRSSYTGATWMRGTMTQGRCSLNVGLYSYGCQGNTASATNQNANDPAVWLPTAKTNTHTGLASDYMPVFTSPTVSPFMDPLPNDFAIIPYHTSASMTAQDTFVVNAGVEEWEMIHTAVNGVEYGNIFFCARVI